MFYIKQFCTLQHLEQVSLCSNSQRIMLDKFNHDLPVIDSNENVLSLFNRSVQKYKERPAIVYNHKTLTYQQLDKLSSKIAKQIITSIGNSGTKKQESIISIIVKRNEDMVICSLAALKAGCAYQPIDPTYPDDHIRIMVNDAKPCLILAHREFVERFSNLNAPLLIVENAKNSNEQDNSSIHLHTSAKFNSLFALLYTSGSSGTPKGVMIEHGNLAAFCR